MTTQVVHYDDATRIELLVTENPKRGPKSKKWFACYKNGMTVGEYRAALKAAKVPTRYVAETLTWDVEHGFVDLIPQSAKNAN